MKITSFRVGARILALSMMSVLGTGPASADPVNVTFHDHVGAMTIDAINGHCTFVESSTSGGSANTHGDFCGCYFASGADAYLVAPPGAPFPGSIIDQVSFYITFACIGPECEYGCYSTFDISCLSFADAGPVYPPAGIPVLVQDGTIQDLTSYFYDVYGSAWTFPGQILIRSDLNLPVPSPTATWGRIKAAYK